MRGSTPPIASAPRSRPRRVENSFSGSPPPPFEQYDSRGHADIQRCHALGHRNSHQEVAPFGHVLVKAAAFAAEHDGGGPGKGHPVIEMFAALVQPIDPISSLLQIVESAVDVHHTDHRHVGQRSRGGPFDGFREPGGAAFRNHYRRGSGGVSGAQDRSQVVGVFNAVEHDVKAACAGCLFERRVTLARAERDHALMRHSSGGAIQPLARLHANRNTALAAQVDQFLQTRPRRISGHQDILERTPGPERFADGMDSCQQGHYDKGTLMSATENAAKMVAVPAAPDTAHEIPDKLYFRIGEVARLAGIKPYVLRFWETEFPSLGPRKTGTGHRLYRRKDVELVLEIKRLLYENRFTIEGARKYLETRRKPETARASRPAKAQGELFSASSPLFDAVRKELRAIAEILK